MELKAILTSWAWAAVAKHIASSMIKAAPKPARSTSSSCEIHSRGCALIPGSTEVTAALPYTVRLRSYRKFKVLAPSVNRDFHSGILALKKYTACASIATKFLGARHRKLYQQ